MEETYNLKINEIMEVVNETADKTGLNSLINSETSKVISGWSTNVHGLPFLPQMGSFARKFNKSVDSAQVKVKRASGAKQR